jgi:hypothetical protein
VRGEVNAIHCQDPLAKRILHAVLNSSTWYQFFCAFTDGRHVNPSDVKDFPIDLKKLTETALGAKLSQLSEELEVCMRANTSHWRKSGLLIESVNSSATKPILDRIDSILAEAYKFTPGELDFIINYDIKYRMGQEEGEDDEE